VCSVILYDPDCIDGCEDSTESQCNARRLEVKGHDGGCQVLTAIFDTFIN